MSITQYQSKKSYASPVTLVPRANYPFSAKSRKSNYRTINSPSGIIQPIVLRATSPNQTGNPQRRLQKKQISMAIDMKFIAKDTNFKFTTLASPIQLIETSLVLTEGEEEKGPVKIIEDLVESPKLNSIFL
jgi:hypothetical protein